MAKTFWYGFTKMAFEFCSILILHIIAQAARLGGIFLPGVKTKYEILGMVITN